MRIEKPSAYGIAGSSRSNSAIRFAVAVSIVVGLALSAVTAQAQDSDANDAYRIALSLYKQERWQLAADALTKFLKSNPAHPKAGFARLSLGLSLTRLNQHKLARAELLRFLKDNPKHLNVPDARFRAAECSLLQSDFRTAAIEFTVFLINHKKHELAEWAHAYLGEAQLHLKNPRVAAKTFEQALEQFPKGRLIDDNRFGLAQAYEALERPADAIEQFKLVTAHVSSPLADRAHFRIGSLYFGTGDYVKANAAFDELERLYPQSKSLPQGRLIAGYAYYKRLEFAKAIERFDAAAKTATQTATATYWKALSLKGLNKQDEASAILKPLYAQSSDPTVAQNILYQWADAEFRAKRTNSAETLFEQHLQRWPQGDLAGDCLYMAALAAFQQQKTAKAEELGARFERDFSKHVRRFETQLLLARIDEATATTARQQKAATRLEAVIAGSEDARTKSLARMSLARVSQTLNDTAKSLTVLAPLIEQVKADGARSEFAEALVLEAHAKLVTKKFDDAAKSAAAYLTIQPMGNVADQALAIRAEASAHVSDRKTADSDVLTLRNGYPKSRYTPHAIFEVAEFAYSKADWAWAEQLYQTLESLGKESGFHTRSISGIAWSQFERKAYSLAAKSYARIVAEDAKHKLAPEAAYMSGQALEAAKQPTEAARAYADAFARFAPEAAAQPGAESQVPLKFAFDAGQRAAELLSDLKKTEAADQAYTALLAKFPQPKNLAALLDDWAYMHLDAENFEKSDAIFKRLVREAAKSDRADNAKLNLAESDLINGQVDAARKAFESLQADTSSDEFVQQASLFRLIGMSVQVGDWKTVKSWSTDLKKRFPKSEMSTETDFNLAQAELHLGNMSDAQQQLLQLKSRIDDPAIANSTWFPNVWVLLAETYLAQKNYDQVAATVNAFEKWNAKSKVLHQAIKIQGEAYYRQALLDNAIAAFERVIKDPAARRTAAAAESQFLIGEAWVLKKDYDKAIVAYLTVYNLYRIPKWQSAALFQVGFLDETRQKTMKAVKTYESLINEFPKSEYATKARARIQALQQ